jgi:hypothetical protein
MRPLQLQTSGKPAAASGAIGRYPTLLELPPPQRRRSRTLRTLQREAEKWKLEIETPQTLKHFLSHDH